MGWSAADIEWISWLRQQGHFQGANAIAELGAQELSNELFDDQTALNGICRTFGAPARNFLRPAPGTYASPESNAVKKTVLARDLWEWLGFNYSHVALDGSAGAVSLDLNFDAIPHAMRGKFALVSNIGITAHVANQLNAFKAIHDLCATGGVMLHRLPAEGFQTHGLLKYNPKFFWMLARSNGYKWLHWDFRFSNARNPLHADVLSELKRFNPEADARVGSYTVADGSLLVVLQKLYDIEFVPPLDVPNGTAPNPDLSERYWTVFQPARFQDVIEKAEKDKL
jgi:SAM-dependent methyltransferase